MRQPVKRSKSSGNQNLFRLQAELDRARETIIRLRAETVYLRNQLVQYQSTQQNPANNQTKSPKANHLRPFRQAPSPRQQQNPANPSWEQPSALVRRPTSPHAAPAHLRQRVRRVRRSPNTFRRVLVGTITLIGIAVLVGTALSLNRPGASNAKNVGTKDAEVTAPLPPTYVTAPPAALVNDELVYNVRTPSKLAADQTLKGAVDGAVALAVSKGFKAENLSITLIDLKSNRFADHYGQILRYPASVAKLFWIMMAFAQIEQGILKPDAALNSDLKAAAVISDNDAASRIIDRISQTQSGPELTGAEFTTWMDKRFRMNNFFKQSGFEGLSLIHKNYPVYSLDMESPTGRDAQLVAQKDGDKSLRNSASTDQAARAMYEIYNRLAVSAKYSDEMIALLKRDLRPEVWKKDTLNCVAGFLGEYLPPDTIFAGKIGYTTQTRHEVAFIETPDRKTAYVLAVFGESPEFSASTTILPEISKHIYLKMTGKNPQPQPSVSPSPSPNGEV